MSGGFKLGRYELHSKLAIGGMAEIWLASQTGPAGFKKQLVVKKILPHLAADRGFVEMFLNEGRYSALINHPNVVHVFELGEEAGSYFLVMEYVPGFSLRAVLGRLRELGTKAPVGCIAQIVVCVCRGLHAAHELCDEQRRPLGLVHRDVSPENVLLSRNGDAKVTDFGIAKAASASSNTRPGHARGKLSYMAPEQLLGEPLDRRADVYAVGAMLYELLAGQTPFTVPTDAPLSLKILKEQPPPLEQLRPDVPPALAAVIARALEKQAGRRWASTLDLARELEPFASSAGAVADWLHELLPPSAEPPTQSELPPTNALPRTTQHASSQSQPRRTWWARASAVLLVVVAVGISTTYRPRAADVKPESPADAGPILATQAPELTVAAPAHPDAGNEATPAVTTKPSTRKVKSATGRLIVRVSPWADVLLDGDMVGSTPLAPLEVSAGRHKVTLTNSELGQTRSLTIDVKPGRDELVEVNLAR